LDETEVAMTTVITSHVKGKNRIFTGYKLFVTGKIWYLIGFCIRNVNYLMVIQTVKARANAAHMKVAWWLNSQTCNLTVDGLSILCLLVVSYNKNSGFYTSNCILSDHPQSQR